MLCLSTKSYTQTTVLGNNAGSLSNLYLGWDGALSNPPLDIKTTLSQPINFFTNNTKRMVLDPSGNLNLFVASQYYSIGGFRILSFGGSANTSSVFVGRDAGASFGFNRLTFVGNGAGFQCVGSDNTYLGYKAGYKDLLGDFNTFVGSNSGYNTTTISGIFGSDNTFLGANSGSQNKTGNYNTILGASADNIIDSIHRTVVIGAMARAGASNSIAIGYGCISPIRNTMILGTNFINVGIGLSNDLAGPGNKLEINDNVNGGSGLRFRQLNSNSTPQASNGLALSVDGNGDVILVPNQSNASGTAQAHIGLTLFETRGKSNYYSLANRFFDYMHAGVPQVCNAYPEYAQINAIFNLATLIAEPRASLIAEAINDLLKDEALYAQRSAGALAARELYNWQEEEKKLWRIYRSL